VRATLGTDSFIGSELAYVGSARDINATGVSSKRALLGNGAEAVARGNLPLRAGRAQGDAVRVRRVSAGPTTTIVNDDSNTSNSQRARERADHPVRGRGGLSYAHLLVDARFTYRAVFDDKLVPTTGSDSQDLQNWSGGLTIGYEAVSEVPDAGRGNPKLGFPCLSGRFGKSEVRNPPRVLKK